MRAKTTISERRACQLVGLSRSVFQYKPIPSEQTQALQARIIDIAHERRRFGYRRIQMMLRREGVVLITSGPGRQSTSWLIGAYLGITSQDGYPRSVASEGCH